MKISRNLPQFMEESAILIIAGRTVAKIYFASVGEINEIEEVEPHAPEYPDKMGFSTVRGHGSTFTWESFNSTEDWRQKEFLNFLKERLAYFISFAKVDAVYLFGPKEDLGLLRGIISKKDEKIIRAEIGKNMVNEHPFMALRELSKLGAHKGESVPVSEEARKILKIRNDGG